MELSPVSRPGDAPVLVSACLLGADCTYSGGNEARRGLLDLLGGVRVIPVCPEVIGGLGVPRPRSEIEGGDGQAVLDGAARVRTAAGTDVTDAYIKGASAAVALATECGAHLAILKSRSPSCGPCGVYDGTHTRRLKGAGVGVTAAAFRRAGLEVFSDDDPPADERKT